MEARSGPEIGKCNMITEKQAEPIIGLFVVLILVGIGGEIGAVAFGASQTIKVILGFAILTGTAFTIALSVRYSDPDEELVTDWKEVVAVMLTASGWMYLVVAPFVGIQFDKMVGVGVGMLLVGLGILYAHTEPESEYQVPDNPEDRL